MIGLNVCEEDGGRGGGRWWLVGAGRLVVVRWASAFVLYLMRLTAEVGKNEMA